MPEPMIAQTVRVLSAAALLACAGTVFAQANPPATPAQPPAPPTPKNDLAASPKKLEPGMPAPALTIDTWVKGAEVKSFETGKVYVIEFWATWCGPCRAAMPHLTELQNQYKDKGLTIIGVASAAAKDSLEAVQKMVTADGAEAASIGYTIAWDKTGATSNAYMKAANKRAIPVSFVIDGKGTVAYIGHPGDLEFILDDIIDGKWDAKKGAENLEKMKTEAQAVFADADSDPKGALAKLAAFEKKHPRMARTLTSQKYNLQMDAQMYDESYQTARVLIDELVKQKDAQALNELSWRIVDPEGDVLKRDVDVAMVAAQHAVTLSKEKDGAILDTLARCYWLKGDKMKAIELQKKAIAAIPKDGPEADMLRPELEATLREYEGGMN